MARKLFMMMALISLVLLAQATVSLATTYEFIGIQGNIEWRHQYSDKNPWDAGTEFIAGGPTADATVGDAVWKIGYADATSYQPYTNSNPGVQNPDGSYTIVFDLTSANPGFFFKLPDGTTISSTDTILTYNVTYTFNDGEGGRYSVQSGQIIAEGTNDLSPDHTPFRFVGYLNDQEGNHIHNLGYLTSYSLTYPDPATPTPIPGAVWLLGTGLLGLACVGRRRRS
jgi:hypothetical protein